MVRAAGSAVAACVLVGTDLAVEVGADGAAAALGFTVAGAGWAASIGVGVDGSHVALGFTVAGSDSTVVGADRICVALGFVVVIGATGMIVGDQLVIVASLEPTVQPRAL